MQSDCTSLKAHAGVRPFRKTAFRMAIQNGTIAEGLTVIAPGKRMGTPSKQWDATQTVMSGN